MNKKTFINLIFSSIIFFLGTFAFVIPAQAAVVQFSEKQIFVDFDGLPFNLNNWAPGMSDQRTIKIENNEGFDVDVYLKANKILGSDILANALTLNVEASSKHISELFTQNVQLTSVKAGQSQDYNLKMNFDQSAGNECQDKTISFDFVLTAVEVGENNPASPSSPSGGWTAPVTIPGGGYVIPEIPMTDNGQVTATPGEGGITTLGNPDGGGVKLVIPAGAVEADTIFTITPVTMGSLTLPSAEGGLFVVDGFAYRITAMRDGQLVTTFPKPLVFTISYTDQQIAGFKQNSLSLYTFNQGNWEIVNSHFDPIRHTITSSINHLSLFALLGEKVSQEKTSEITPQVAGESTVVTPSKETSSSILNPSNKQEEGVPSSNEEPAGLPEGNPPQTKATPGVAVAGSAPTGFKGFLAAVGSAWQNVNKTAFFSLWAIILAIILTLIGIKIWRKRKSR